MIHSETIKSLTEEELTLFWAMGEHFFNKMGLQCKYGWLQMIRVPVLEHIMSNCNLKEEYYPLRDSLLTKLKEGVF